MNNIVLDVAIGLTFIYLLYSLLASTINEFVAMIFAYRQRMLEKAIEQMCDGKNYSYYWWDKVLNIYLWLRQDLKEIVTKEIPKINTKDFFKTCHINSRRRINDKTYLKRGKLNKKASLFAANITNHPQYRRKSEQSILFKKPAYLSSSAFSDIFLDVLGNRRSNNSSAPLLMNDIKGFVSSINNNPDLKGILNFYIEQANGDIQKFKLLIEDWYDDTMNRVSGWYKRQATKVLFVIGFGLAITFNVSTIEIVNKLSVNKDLREAMAQSASNYVKQRGANSNANTTTTINNSSKNSDSLLNSVKQQIQDIQKLYSDTISSVNRMMGLGWGDFGHQEKITPTLLLNKTKDSTLLINYINKLPITKDSAFMVNAKKTSLELLLFKNGQVIDSVFLPLNVNKAKYSINAYLNKKYSNYGKPTFCEIIKYVFTLPNLLGFLLTALAITLGAPFWFDLLNKFVNIRAGGNKPSEDKSRAIATSKTVVLNQKPAINSFA